MISVETKTLQSHTFQRLEVSGCCISVSIIVNPPIFEMGAIEVFPFYLERIPVYVKIRINVFKDLRRTPVT